MYECSTCGSNLDAGISQKSSTGVTRTPSDSGYFSGSTSRGTRSDWHPIILMCYEVFCGGSKFTSSPVQEDDPKVLSLSNILSIPFSILLMNVHASVMGVFALERQRPLTNRLAYQLGIQVRSSLYSILGDILPAHRHACSQVLKPTSSENAAII